MFLHEALELRATQKYAKVFGLPKLQIPSGFINFSSENKKSRNLRDFSYNFRSKPIYFFFFLAAFFLGAAFFFAAFFFAAMICEFNV